MRYAFCMVIVNVCAAIIAIKCMLYVVVILWNMCAWNRILWQTAQPLSRWIKCESNLNGTLCHIYYIIYEMSFRYSQCYSHVVYMRVTRIWSRVRSIFLHNEWHLLTQLIWVFINYKKHFQQWRLLMNFCYSKEYCKIMCSIFDYIHRLACECCMQCMMGHVWLMNSRWLQLGVILFIYHILTRNNRYTVHLTSLDVFNMYM